MEALARLTYSIHVFPKRQEQDACKVTSWLDLIKFASKGGFRVKFYSAINDCFVDVNIYSCLASAVLQKMSLSRNFKLSILNLSGNFDQKGLSGWNLTCWKYGVTGKKKLIKQCFKTENGKANISCKEIWSTVYLIIQKSTDKKF